MRANKQNPWQEYRLKRREEIEASPLLRDRFPRLKALRVRMEFFDPEGSTKRGEVTWKLNVEHAKSVVWFSCPGAGCLGGDFELSQILARAVAERRNMALGELRCLGTRKHGAHEPIPCHTLLRYELKLHYDGD